jgi:titin
LNVSTPAPGAPITIVAEGYRPGSTVTILIYSEPVKLGSAIADANGRISATVTVPSTFAPGSDHTIEAQGIRPDGAPLTRSVHVALAAPDATGGSLASTGVRVAEMTGLGVAIIGTGWLILMMTRRRRNLTTTPRV